MPNPIAVTLGNSKTILERNSGFQELTIDITLSGTSSEIVQVPYSISLASDTATIDDDYSINSLLPIVFNPGDPTTKTLTFRISGDQLSEPDEIFTITLGDPIGATLGNRTSATVTILNDDQLPVVAIASVTNASETGTAGSIILRRTGNLDLPTQVNLSFTGSSATLNDDYQALPTVGRFQVGESQIVIPVTAIDDDLYEGNENIQVALLSSTTYSVSGSGTSNIVVEDNEVKPTITITPPIQSIAEKNIGDTASQASFTVSLTGKSSTPITVDYFTTDGTATAGSDYTATTGTITFAAGTTSQVITVPIIPDNSVESDKYFEFNLANPVGADISPSIAQVGVEATILDDDPLPVISVIPINDPVPSAGRFQFKRFGDLSVPLTVSYQISKSTDGTQPPQEETVNFEIGQSEVDLPLTASSSTIFQEVENISVSLADQDDYQTVAATKSAVLQLISNAPAPNVEINDASLVEGDSGSSNLVFTVRLTAPSAQTITTDYGTANDTAIAGVDFTAVSGSLNFAPQEVEKTIAVPILGDQIVETDEAFKLLLSNITLGVLEVPDQTTATGTIVNDDTAVVGKPTLKKADSNIFTLENGVGQPTTVRFRKLSAQALNRNEVGLFTVDNERGAINGILPGQNDYLQAALQRSQVIFSALGESTINASLDGPIDRSISLSDTAKLGFYLVADGTTDDVKEGKNANVILLSSGNASDRFVNFLDVANGPTQFSWEDTRSGDNDFNDLVFQVELAQSPVTTGAQQQGTLEVLDLRNLSGKQTLSLEISGDAWFSNTVGFYQVDDLSGRVNGLAAGSEGYLAAALRKVVASGKNGETPTVQVDGGTILAPFLIVNGSVQSFLADVKSANVYLGNIGGKSADGFDHVRLLGDNKFGFEDLWGGGDRDYNDAVVKALIL